MTLPLDVIEILFLAWMVGAVVLMWWAMLGADYFSKRRNGRRVLERMIRARAMGCICGPRYGESGYGHSRYCPVSICEEEIAAAERDIENLALASRLDELEARMKRRGEA